MEIVLPDYKKIASEVKKKETELTEEEIKRLKTEKERMEKERVRMEILDKIAQSSEIELPQHLIAVEQERMMKGLKTQVPQILGIDFEDYLEKIKQTEKELADSFLLEAQKRVKNFLVLKAIGEKENIVASDEEIKNEADKISQNYPETGKLDQEQLKEYTKEVICHEKTFQFLESLMSGGSTS